MTDLNICFPYISVTLKSKQKTMAVEDINLNEEELDGSFQRLDKNVVYYFVSTNSVRFYF